MARASVVATSKVHVVSWTGTGAMHQPGADGCQIFSMGTQATKPKMSVTRLVTETAMAKP